MELKIALILILVGVSNIFAAPGYSQVAKVSVEMNNATLEKVLDKIESQSEFYFVFNQKQIDVNRVVSVQAENKLITDILPELFKGTNVNYMVFDRKILLTTDPLDNNLLAVTSTGEPQQKQIPGTVTDKNGSPLPGVNVVVTGTTQGTMTDINGKYSIEVPAGSKSLTFTFVGMEHQEITIGTLTRIDVTMAESATALEEVVVIGYGTTKKSDLTGSVTQIKSGTLNAFPTSNVMQSLSGRSSGVQVLQTTGAPGASISIRIRGSNSIQGNNEPLYVVDGFPVSNATTLNNSDIESIEILKDASSTAIYGSRGANGVVLISTKKGKSGTNIVDFESSYSSQSLIRKMHYMNAREYATFYNLWSANGGGAPFFTEAEINSFGDGFDWQDFIYQTAPMLTTSLNVKGGNEKTKFSITGSILNQDGILKGSTYDRYTIRSNIDHQFSKKFSAVLSTAYTRSKSNRKDSGGGNSASLIGGQNAPPIYTPYNDDGSYRLFNTTSFISSSWTSPVYFLNEQTNLIESGTVLINGAFVFKPIEELTFKFSGGIENNNELSDSYQTTKFFLQPYGSANVGRNQFTSLLNENTISYVKSINNKHNISAVAGLTYQDFLNTSLSASGNGFNSDIFETYSLSAAASPGIPGSDYSKSVLLSYLGRINYNFKNKYYATASYRADGCSKFSDGKKWGYFPSAALAWKISEEAFLKNNLLISNLKLRTSWGMTGSQAIGPYITMNMLSSGKTVFNDALYNTFAPGTDLPGDLKWETTEQMNIGFDIGIKKNLIVITADYYVKNTKDLLNTVTLPSSLGFTSTIQNVGQVQNKGFEFGLDAQLFTGNFKWDVNTNISFNRNKVVKLYRGQDILSGYLNVVVLQDVTTILREGRPMSQFWGYLEDGYDDKGKIKYKDLNNDGILSIADKAYIGDYGPDFTYGLNSNMSYKNFELSIFLQGTYGNDIFNLAAVENRYDYIGGNNIEKDVLGNSWTPTNTNAKYPIIGGKSIFNISDRFIEDGSYLRLKNIQLAYNFPVNSLGINKVVQSLQCYVSGQNLLTFTKYSGSDPEVNSDGLGIDNRYYPNSKSFTVGIRARF